MPGSVDDVRRHAEPVAFSHLAGHGFKYGIGNSCARLTLLLRHSGRRRASTATARDRDITWCAFRVSRNVLSAALPNAPANLSGATVMSCSE